MKKYEIVYIIHPDLEGSTGKITEKVKSVLGKNNAKILTEESWGKKKLAYEIGRNSYGIYEFMLVEMEAASVKEVERTLRISEEIIRSMVIQAEEEAKSKTEAVKKVKKETEKPKEVKKEEVKKEVKAPKKTKAQTQKEEKERQKELDEKLKEIIGPDKES